ncbi:ABC transporter permease, partial [candidate division KSB1 bacterium]
EYYFLDENFDDQYKYEEKTGSMMSIFTFLGVFIACLGLFGLVSFTAEQKTKEIGIRKILGASAAKLMIMFSKEFLIWVVFANAIAWPASYYYVNKWLQNFAYRTDIDPYVFIAAGAFVLFIAILTIAFQTVKAALANPVDSLRYE